MTETSLCFGWWAECPRGCHRDEPEESQEKCFVWRICFDDWFKSGGRLGLQDIIENMEKID